MILESTLFSLVALCQSQFGCINPQAPKETKQFESMLGSWDIVDYQLQQNGKWKQGPGAEWHWYAILDGYAIQDDWIAPPKSGQIDDEDRQFGTNIRIYNPQKHHWEMAWISKKGQQLDTFTALERDDTIVMEGLFSGNQARITFFKMTDTNFQWKLELSGEEGWQEVYRIKGSKKAH